MRIYKEETIAIAVDVQEKLVPAMDQADEIIRRNVLLTQGLNTLGVESLFLRQYPKGLGDIIPELRAVAGEYSPYDKMAYSAVLDEAIAEKLETLRARGIKNILVSGVEAHICVLQTCIDLKAKGFRPIIVADAVGSRNPFDKKIGLKRAREEEITLTTVESILFELLQVAGTDEFKVISKLVR